MPATRTPNPGNTNGWYNTPETLPEARRVSGERAAD